jgi:iron(III) transport system permease protein
LSLLDRGVIFVIGIHVFPFTYFLTYTALRSVDASYEEAASLLGARRWAVFLKVSLPVVAPAITGGALLSAIDSMALFGPQAFLGLPAQITFLPTRIYGVIGSYPPRWSEASALSLTLVVLTACGLLLQRGYLERRSYATVSGRGVRVETIRLGGWKWALAAFCLGVVFLSSIAPFAVLTIAAFSRSWVGGLSTANLTLANFDEAIINNQTAVRGIVNSFRLAAAAGACVVVVGAMVAYVDLRTRARGRRLLDYLAALPLGLPGTVMAVGVLIILVAIIRRATTELVLTDRRIITKRGFISRDTVEMNLGKVESLHVTQGLLGRILGYGDVTVVGTGSSLEPLRGISRPLELRRKLGEVAPADAARAPA